MAGLIQKFKDLFFKPDISDQERVERWKTEVDEADRLKELHLQSRKQDKKTEKAEDATRMPISAPYKREKKGLIKKKGLTVEDFERAKQINKPFERDKKGRYKSKKNKNKTLSSNF